MKAAVLISTVLVLMSGLIVTGCSKSDEVSDNVASNLVGRIKTPIDDAREISAKAAKTRDPELPK